MPSGTASDPWVVASYSQLVAQAALGGYIVLANDINIADEYPNGDMETLVLSDAYIDGQGHTIHNWYKIDSSGYFAIYSLNSGSAEAPEFTNVNFNNIYIAENATAFFKKSNTNYDIATFDGCTFRGVLYKPFSPAENASNVLFNECGLYLDTRGNKPFGANGAAFDNTRLQLTSTYSGTGFLNQYGRNRLCKNSYLELHLPNASDGALDAYVNPLINSVVDITSNAQISLGYGNNTVSIVNSTHAPNISPDGTNCKAVTDANWLNTTYLHDTIGFNVG